MMGSIYGTEQLNIERARSPFDVVLEEARTLFEKLLRVVGVGGVATLLHVITATLVHRLLGTADLGANFIGFCSSVMVSYLGHSRLTFAVTPDYEKCLPRLVFVSLLGLVASSLIVWFVGVIGGGSFFVAMVAVALLLPLTNFLALRFWVFTHNSSPFLPSWPMVAITLGAAFVVMTTYWNWPINQDTAWYLVATRKMLGGARLYVDVADVNPPLIFYLTTPALLIADALHISDSNGQYLALVLLYMLSLLWTGAVLRRSVDIGPMRRLVFFGIMTAIYILPSAVQIGQREHLLILFLSPWVVGHLSGSFRPQPIPRSMFAAVGMCIKPIFLIFPIAFVSWDIIRTRSIRPLFSPSYLSMLLIAVIYVVFTVARHPEYLNELVPTTGQVFGAYKLPLLDIMRGHYMSLSIGMLALIPTLVRGSVGAAVFGLATLAALISFLVQSTGFGYHLFPYFTYALLAGAWFILTSTHLSIRLVISAIACALLLSTLYSRGKYDNAATNEVVRVANEFGPINRLFAASTILDPGVPAALRLGIEWTSRYPSNWLYPGALSALERTDCITEPERCQELTSIVDKNRIANLQDIDRYEPDLIVIDRSATGTHINPLSWLNYMSATPGFAEVMEDYTLVKSTAGMDYYLRNDG
ncbi:GtrA family protein [Aliiroseovarius sp. 2305UL8-7]|uniref:GtrA family protein n=1 Tax=Aliiroseovarius conchicola TaxID=3121637 RepID=UPI003526CA55